MSISCCTKAQKSSSWDFTELSKQAGTLFNYTTTKVKEFAVSIPGQIVIGFGLGLVMHKIYAPLTNRILKLFPSKYIPGSIAFTSMPKPLKFLMTPFITVLGPIMEEQMFRGFLYDSCKNSLEYYYNKIAPSPKVANIAARVTTVFFTSIIFGLVHFSNAIFFMCNPLVFLPQVIAATIMGFMFALAKEFSGDIVLPSAMHVGNNTLAWAAMNKFV